MAYLPTKPFSFNVGCVTSAASFNSGFTFFFQPYNTTAVSLTASARTRFYFPVNCILKAVYGNFNVQGTLATSEHATVQFRKNGTDITVISSTVTLDAVESNWGNGALSVNISAGDYIEFMVVNPTYSTAPTVIFTNISLFAE